MGQLTYILLVVLFATPGRTFFPPLDDPQFSTSDAPVPVIIDTDIGSDIDDSFAVVYAAQSSNLDIKLVVTCTDDTTARARITAKLLTIIGRDKDIPIGIGLKNDNRTAHTLFDWASSYDLGSYKGGVFEDGIEQMGKIILNSPTTVNIICIGPMTNFPELLRRYPGVAKKARIYAMAGSIYRGYRNSSNTVAEYNVYMCPWCMQKFLSAGWQSITFTPLDTCGTVILGAPHFAEMLAGMNSTALGLVSSLMYFCIFTNQYDCSAKNSNSYPVLYDTNAVLLMLPEAKNYIDFQELRLSVDSRGYTKVDNEHGVPVQVALNWQLNGLENFEESLAKTLTG
jgi:inosine-uridine nucleoside N-ribohydrolase